MTGLDRRRHELRGGRRDRHRRLQLPGGGQAGEAALGPTAAAIGNAVRDALGVPVRDLPLTPERIIEALG